MISIHTRLRIRWAFLKLYSQQGLYSMTVTEVCKEVPISRSTFYAYYVDIYAILDEIIDELISTLISINSSFKYADLIPTSQYRPFWRLDETLNYIKDNALVFKALLKNSESSFIYRWKKSIKDDFRARYEYERINPENLNLILEFISSSFIGIYSYWVNNLNEVSVQDIKNIIFNRITNDFN